MKMDIVYRTETHVSKVRVKHEKKELNVIVTGWVERYSERRLWIFPLRDKYKWRMSTMLIGASGEIRTDVPWADYTFDSQKRIAAKKGEMKETLKKRIYNLQKTKAWKQM